MKVAEREDRVHKRCCNSFDCRPAHTGATTACRTVVVLHTVGEVVHCGIAASLNSRMAVTAAPTAIWSGTRYARFVVAENRRTRLFSAMARTAVESTSPFQF